MKALVQVGARILLEAAWAPLAVIGFRWVAMIFHVRKELDHLIHFSGGLAIAYFLDRALRICSAYTGELRPGVRYLLTYTSACTVAVFWELGEYAMDIRYGSHIQHSVSETLLDLFFGVSGAAVTVGGISVVEWMRNRKAV